jgi:hypothetical protein
MRDQKDQGVVSSLIVFGLLIMIVLTTCTGCTTPPVIPKFPEAPVKAGAMEQCPDLEKLKDGAKLSDVSKTITINYSTYYECAVKSDTWIEWYQINKINFDKIGK